MSMQNHQQANQSRRMDERPLIISLNAITASMLPLVGGKAANLGELMHAGLPVPQGFCITTAAYETISSLAGPDSTRDQPAAQNSDDSPAFAQWAAAERTILATVTIPSEIATAIREAYEQLAGEGSPFVAVRSSATAEDLPFASFAGQQETFLNIRGSDALLEAVRRCWASLWTERAIAYRNSLGIDHRTARLAVVVQRMVDAQVSGVLFSANPLTGRRRQAVINASFGLGEPIVSGAVNPDRWVIDSETDEILERRLGDKQFAVRGAANGGTERAPLAGKSEEAALSDAQAVTLAKLGAQVEQHFRMPQDVEWAIDDERHIWLTQARAITTLFPLPGGDAASASGLHAYLSFNVQQGTFKPFTPMGVSAMRLFTSSIMALAGFAPHDALQGPGFVVEAAGRIFVDVTGALRSTLGRLILQQLLAQAEAQAAAVFARLAADPRFSTRPVARLAVLRTLGRLLVVTGTPWHLSRALITPATARRRLLDVERAMRAASQIEPGAGPDGALAAVERLICEMTPRLLSATFPVMAGSLGATALAGKLLGDLASAGDMQAITRGAPFNPTTQMSMDLWALAQSARNDPVTAELVRRSTPEQLAESYWQRHLPRVLQDGAAEFLSRYGHRSVNELDLGMPRWSEDPAYWLGALAGYLDVDNPEQAPDAQYRLAGQKAETLLAELVARAKRRSRLRGLLASFFLRRARELTGLREMPRYLVALLLASCRRLLRRTGDDLTRAGALDHADDIFFVTLPEVHAALSGRDLRGIAWSRREHYERELARRHVPIVLLSDGTEPSAEEHPSTLGQDTLHGTPVSPGRVTARAQVIREPRGARLSKGEILVAPSTDPGWTPLFLLAGGLVMETGGEISHGAIVARECGIPAVVGVSGATEQIQSGRPITVDGSTGRITINL
jgi:phosphohistidine swiveling domain-containing protein